MTQSSKKIIGILTLENNPFGDIYGTPQMKIKGSLGNPRTFRFPVIYEKVRGATSKKIASGDSQLAQEFNESAMRLERRGASVVITNCGFAALLQQDLSQIVSIPVITSSLVLLPFVSTLISKKSKIGLLTTDKKRLTDCGLVLLEHAIKDPRLVINDVEGRAAWLELGQENPILNIEKMKQDVIEVCQEMFSQNSDIEAVILECTAMVQFRNDILKYINVPIFDIVEAAHFVMRCL